MIIIPIRAEPNQFLDVELAGQYCQINIYQKTQGLFLDLSANGVEIVTGILCHTSMKLVRYPSRGFIGDLMFIDQQGTSDPVYSGLGERWQLCYLTESEVA